MCDPIHRLVLGIEKRRGGEEPAKVLDAEWDGDGLPSRFDFHEAVDRAYASIDLPFFPSSAWVTVVTATTSVRIETSEPQDQAMVAAGLWTAVVTTASDYG